jgi:hypothetical protein
MVFSLLLILFAHTDVLVDDVHSIAEERHQDRHHTTADSVITQKMRRNLRENPAVA